MSNEAAVHDDLVPEQTEGFKVGEKKTIDEYQKLGKSWNENMHWMIPHAISP
jgi:Rho GDP-dissociation inhibitor